MIWRSAPLLPTDTVWFLVAFELLPRATLSFSPPALALALKPTAVLLDVNSALAPNVVAPGPSALELEPTAVEPATGNGAAVPLPPNVAPRSAP